MKRGMAGMGRDKDGRCGFLEAMEANFFPGMESRQLRVIVVLISITWIILTSSTQALAVRIGTISENEGAAFESVHVGQHPDGSLYVTASRQGVGWVDLIASTPINDNEVRNDWGWYENHLLSDRKSDFTSAVDNEGAIHIVTALPGITGEAENSITLVHHLFVDGQGTTERLVNGGYYTGRGSYGSWHFAVATDERDNVHIAEALSSTSSWDPRHGLTYRTNTSGTWSSELVDDTLKYKANDINIAIDSNNKVHMVYGFGGYGTGGQIRYATNALGGWKLEDLLTPSSSPARTCTFGIDSNNNIYVAYKDKNDAITILAKKNGVWQHVSIGTANFYWGELDIAFDQDDVAHVVYRDGAQIMMASDHGGVWKSEAVADIGNEDPSGGGPSLLFGPNNMPFIVYTAHVPNKAAPCDGDYLLKYVDFSRPSVKAPIVGNAAYIGNTTDRVRVQAMVDPKDADTQVYVSYRIEKTLPDGWHSSVPFCTDKVELPAGSGLQVVRFDVTGLGPNETIVSQVVAKSDGGIVQSTSYSYVTPTEITIPGVQPGEWIFDFGNFTNQQGFTLSADRTLKFAPGATFRTTLTKRCTGGGYGDGVYEETSTIDDTIESMGFVDNQLRLSAGDHSAMYSTHYDENFSATGEVVDPNILRGRWSASFSQVVIPSSGGNQICGGSTGGAWQAHRKGVLFKPSTISVPKADADGTYTVTWEASLTPGVSYLLQEATDPAFSVGVRNMDIGSAVSKAITGRPTGATYYYRAKATLPGQTGSGWLTADTGCAVPGTTAAPRPATITVPAADPDGGYPVSWKASTPAAGLTYLVEESTSPNFTDRSRIIYQGTATQTAISGRAKGKTYYYRVRTMRPGAKDSDWRTGSRGCAVPGVVTIRTPSVIGVPSSDTDGSCSVAWQASATPDVTYILEEGTTATFNVGRRVVYSGPALSAAITGLETGKTYHYRVRAIKPGAKDSLWRTGSNGCAVTL